MHVPSAPSAAALLRRRDVALFLASQLLVTAGVASQATVLGKLVFDITHRELDLGLVGLVEFLPAAALAVVAGALADRRDRRRVGAAGLAGEACAAVALVLLVRTQPTSIGPILMVVGVFGVARAFASPAIRALAPTLVEPLALPRLVALYNLSLQAGLIAGPVVGAFLYAVGPTWSFGFTLLCSTLGACGLLCIRPQAPIEPTALSAERRPGWRDALEGITLIRRSPVLLGTISLDLFAVLFGGAIALLPVIAEERLGVGVVGLGWLRAAVGVGAAVMTGVLALRPLRRRIGPTLLAVVAVFGVATIGLGLTRSFPVAVLCLLVASGADAVSMFIRATIVPLVTPDAWRGRVSAVENVFIGASNELGAFESGLAGQWLGAAGAVVTGGAATLLVVGVWSMVFPAIGRIDRFEDVQPAALR